MYGDYALAGKGLKTLFLSEIVGLIATVLSGVALVGSLAGLAGLILGLVGLHTASPTHPYLKMRSLPRSAILWPTFWAHCSGKAAFSPVY